jgi:hypothetical protein
MIVVDENIPEDQCQLLRKWRFHIQQIGQDVGQQGMKDQEHVLPLLHKLNRPTFFTHDLDFFAHNLCHDAYCLVCLDVSQNEGALFVRGVLRHPSFRTNAKRKGAVIRASPVGLTVLHPNASKADHIPWNR